MQAFIAREVFNVYLEIFTVLHDAVMAFMWRIDELDQLDSCVRAMFLVVKR
jgi:hypothetical protein